MLRRIALCVGVGVILIAFPFGCSLTKQEMQYDLLMKSDHDISHFLLTELGSNRLVMLGDAKHGSSLYLQEVISFLNYWVDTLESGPVFPKGVPRRLVLVLEQDSCQSDALKKYFGTGDIFGLFGSDPPLATHTTMAKMEYYSDLRDIWKRIEARNANAPDSARIDFDVLGPEMSIDATDWSLAKRDTFFIYQRDEYSSSKIIEYLANHPDFKGLMFYGNAHLAKEKTTKTCDSLCGTGYFLGHYLDEGLTHNGGFFAINQVVRFQGVGSGDLLCYPRTPYGIDVHRLAFSLHDCGPVIADGIIVHSQIPAPELALSRVPSERIVRHLLSIADEWAFGKNDFQQNWYEAIRHYLSTVAGCRTDSLNYSDTNEVRSDVERWKNWYATSNLDVVNDLETRVPFHRLLEYMSHSSASDITQYEKRIAWMLNTRPFLDTAATAQQRADMYRDYLNDERRAILIDQLVNLLWVATDSEHQKAVAILKRETGQNFETAKQWMVWYRQNYTKIHDQSRQNVTPLDTGIMSHGG